MSKLLLSALFSLAALPAMAATPASTQVVLQKMAPSSKVACKADGYGQASCTADGVEVSVIGCGKDGMYGAITANGGVDVTDAINGRGRPAAHLADRQFVCVAAIQKGSDTQHYFVIAVPTASVPACKGNALCRGGDRPIQWKKSRIGKPCHVAESGDYTGDCAAGWVEEGVLDQYANGI